MELLSSVAFWVGLVLGLLLFGLSVVFLLAVLVIRIEKVLAEPLQRLQARRASSGADVPPSPWRADSHGGPSATGDGRAPIPSELVLGADATVITHGPATWKPAPRRRSCSFCNSFRAFFR